MTTNIEQFQRENRAIGRALKVRYNPMTVDSADGSRIFDVEGRTYLDFGSSWSLAHLGYSNEHVRDAIVAQLGKTLFAGAVSSGNTPAIELAEKLQELTRGTQQKKAIFGLSGSDACEGAQRLVLLATGRRRIVSFIGSWHGTSDASMAMSGHSAFTRYVSGAHVTKVPYPDPYRNPFGDGSGNVTDQCLSYLENYVFRTVCPPEDTAAIFVESVQADSGDVVPPPDFMPRLRALCDRHGILMVLDDIKVGLGRTGKMFSYEHSGIEPDILVLGKSLGGGQPLSAVVGPPDILDVGSGLAVFTTAGNATSCAAGLATIEVIEREGLVQRAAESGAYLLRRLTESLSGYEIVGDVRGLGMIQGIELVKDRASKEPNQPAAAKIAYRAWQLGLVCYYAGQWGNVIEITPPLILTRGEIDEGVSILTQAVADVLEGKVTDEEIAPYDGW